MCKTRPMLLSGQTSRFYVLGWTIAKDLLNEDQPN